MQTNTVNLSADEDVIMTGMGSCKLMKESKEERSCKRRKYYSVLLSLTEFMDLLISAATFELPLNISLVL